MSFLPSFIIFIISLSAPELYLIKSTVLASPTDGYAYFTNSYENTGFFSNVFTFPYAFNKLLHRQQ